jgi:hypothetical protein
MTVPLRVAVAKVSRPSNTRSAKAGIGEGGLREGELETVDPGFLWYPSYREFVGVEERVEESGTVSFRQTELYNSNEA